ncbi:MAG: hypothetical protein FVQ84_08215 [Planctomycetes bacterium]|nr:hypothetical protein [Planctomycetota bacterium]
MCIAGCTTSLDTWKQGNTQVPTLVVLCLVSFVVLLNSGCKQITIGGKERPLLTHERIEGSVQIGVQKETNENKVQGNTTKANRMEILETLRLNTKGNLYHPNLLAYTAAIGLGLQQQRFKSDRGTDNTKGMVNEYDLTLDMFRNKSYPLNLYTNRSDVTRSRQFAGSIRSELEQSGGMLNLNLKDWPMIFQFSESEINQNAFGSSSQDDFFKTDERFKYSTSHSFSSSSKLRFGYEREDTSERRLASSRTSIRDKYDLTHDLTFGAEDWHRLDSDLYIFNFSGDSNQKRLRWLENLRLKHSQNLRTDYRFSFNERETTGNVNSETRGRIGFRHKLYKSLTTNGNLFTSKSDTGNNIELENEGGGLVFQYDKFNPFGQLRSSYNVQFIKSEQTGGGTSINVIDEQHAYDVSSMAPIELDRRNIVPGSITITGSGGIPLYDPVLDYNIFENSGRTNISVVIGGEIFQDAVTNGGTINIFVTYEFFAEPEHKNDILTQNFSMRQQFDNGLGVYYNHRNRREDISSNVTEVTPDEMWANTFGAEYSNKGLSLAAEYLKENSTQLEYNSKRLRAGYNWSISHDTRAGIQTWNFWNDFRGTNPHEVTVFNVGGQLSSRLSDKHTVSGGIDYHDDDDSQFGVTRGLDWNLELQYNFRQLSFITGIRSDFLDNPGRERDNTTFYFRLLRSF